MENQYAIEMLNITKKFPGIIANDNITLQLRKGEIHALLGENGAGKSTLMKIIAGAQGYTSGHMYINDQEVVFHSTKEAEKMGIAMIYQEFNMVPELSVAENMYLGRLPKTQLGVVDWKKLYQDADEVLKKLGLKFDCRNKVKNLSVAESQMTEIAKCLTIGAKVIIMDEPTASLTRTEVNQLLRTVNYLRDKNITVVFVSHRLDEVKEISDRITVIRDGEIIGTWAANQLSPGDITELMTGKTIVHQKKLPNSVEGKVVLELKKLCRKGQFEDVSLKLHQGEVLGLCGLLGAGRTELALSLFGITRADSGDIYLEGKPVTIKDNTHAVKLGIAYVSEDRLTLGAVLPQSISDNMVLSILDRLKTPSGFIDENRKETLVKEWIQDLDIKVTDPNNPLSTLSGGNQQKVVLAKWILTRPKVLILDAPTVGVDIGAKDSIYQLIHRLSGVGISVILITDEAPEAYYNCDRIFHMKRGKIIHELLPSNYTEQQLAEVING